MSQDKFSSWFTFLIKVIRSSRLNDTTLDCQYSTTQGCLFTESMESIRERGPRINKVDVASEFEAFASTAETESTRGKLLLLCSS